MELSAIILSRVLAFIDIMDLSPEGRVFFPDLLAGLVEKFRFQKFPKTFEETDETKGVKFSEGTWDGMSVLDFTVYNNALVMDTRAGTHESQRVVTEALEWAVKEFGIQYHAGMIKRWRYVSDLTVISEVPLLFANPAQANLSSAVGKEVSKILGETLTFHPTRSSIDFERHPKNMPMAPFDIQRRAETPFSENKYFSEAPLPTDLHFGLLEGYERDLKDFLPIISPGRVGG
jgi:hypothetical protein